ncbi:MAG: hypothetical protein P8H33_06505 [Crocinitomicaceae bacterium]|nr:hypothetical protein [Crocinitomicaceae bacterium]|tara:strand:- start:1094 stop:1669 length:576 start_codon:yes stop_codon:yes gene_type:complete
MEALHFIARYPEINAIYFSTIDPEAIIQFLRGRDFCVEEMWEMKHLKDGSFEEEQLGWPNEEPLWVRSNHAWEINGLMETFDFRSVCNLKIKLEDGGYISQNYGEFMIRLGDGEDLKTPSIKVLEMYGFFAAEKIWKLAGDNPTSLPIDSLLGLEENDVTKKDLDLVVINNEKIIESHRKLDKIKLKKDEK